MILNDNDREHIKEMNFRGLPLQAYGIASKYGPIRTWTDPRDRLVASYLVQNLGALRLSHALSVAAYAGTPDNLEIRTQYADTLLNRRGPLACWEFLQDCRELPSAQDRDLARWYAFHARVSGIFRDFDEAERWMARAAGLGVDEPVLCGQQVFLLQCQDRYADALDKAREMLGRYPWYSYAWHAAAHLLMLEGLCLEAERVLAEATQRFEVSSLWSHLYLVRTELDNLDGAAICLDRYEQTTPLREKEINQWLLLARSYLASRRGDYAGAADKAAEADAECAKAILQHLKDADDSCRRNVLRVPFVRQHYETCAPATLTALSRFWSKEVDHLQVAEEICYGGTPHYEEREWTQRNGFVTREFTVSWDSARLLIDRGIPFGLVTTTPSAAHMQAVVGYDESRGTFLVRDPSTPFVREDVCEELLKRQKATGPRGMAMAPREQPALLEDTNLPDADLHDRYGRFEKALEVHQTETADTMYREMAQTDPEQYLTLQARWQLAHYNHDAAASLAACEAMAERFPDDDFAQSRRVMALDNHTQREQRLALVRKRCADRKADPFFLVDCAWLLSDDAREHETALKMLRRATRRGHRLEPILYITAQVLWSRRRWQEALALYRYAVCMDDKNEIYSQVYFSASRHLKQMDTTLNFLEGRFRRFGSKSSQPARTLFMACEQIDQVPRGLKVLEEALSLRPDDWELMLFAADVRARHGDFTSAEELLVRAQPRSRRTDWLRTSAAVARYRGEPKRSLELWRQILELEPNATDAQREVANLLGVTEGPAAAIAHLRKAVTRLPHDFALYQLLIDWLREEDPDAWLETARRLLEIAPGDRWTHREMAMALSKQRRMDEALEHAETACRVDEHDPVSFGVRGLVQSVAGDFNAARDSFRKALTLSVDLDWAIHELMRVCRDTDERRRELTFVHEQFVAQVIFGDGLLAWRLCARGVFDDVSLLSSLREALDARPDLWHAWSAMAQQLTDMGRLKEAVELSREAATRFPLLPRIWLDHANACRLAGDAEGEIESLRKAFDINPCWSVSARLLAGAYERRGDWASCTAILTRAVSSNPLDAHAHGVLAGALWNTGQREEALAQVEKAVRLDPSYHWAWNAYRQWTAEMHRPEAPEIVARELVERRPGDSDSWLILSELLSGDHTLQERLDAIDRAVRLHPRNADAYDRKADLLASAGRTEEALAACRPEVWGDHPPAQLRSRAAWILFYRGRVREAVALWESMAKDEPQNPAVWKQLADACLANNQPDRALQAARKMADLEPTDPTALTTLGDALAANGKHTEATGMFRKAFTLAPDYLYAGAVLFDLLVKAGTIGEAGAVLDKLEHHVPGPLVTARRVVLDTQLDNLGGALKGIQALCRCNVPGSDGALALAFDAAVRRRWTREVEAVVQQAIDDPQCNPDLGRVWMQSSGMDQQANRAESWVTLLLDHGEIGVRTAEYYLNLMHSTHLVGRAASFVRRHADALKRDVRTWGSAGYALATQRQHSQALQWLLEGADRQGVRPWMLFNLLLAMRESSQDDAAYRVALKALALPPDHTSPCISAWAGFCEAVAGNLRAAADHTDRITEEAMSPREILLLHMTRAILVLTKDPQDGKQRIQSNHHLRLAARQRRRLSNSRSARRAYRRGIRRLARMRGGIWGVVWHFFHYLPS